MFRSRTSRVGVAVACSVAVLAALSGWYRLVLDESLSIRPGSLTYHLLVPPDLKKNRLAGFGVVEEYQRSAADGPKPTITVASLMVDGPADVAIHAITNAYVGRGYSASRPGHLVRGSTELDVSADEACMSHCRITLALSQHE